MVRVVGVTKGFGPDAVRGGAGGRARDLGENYAAELVAKAPRRVDGRRSSGTSSGPCSETRWRLLAPLVGLWQSVAREAEGVRIARFAPGAKVLVQVDTTGLPGRNGCPPPERGGAGPAPRATWGST